jgi:hypothetical protein
LNLVKVEGIQWVLLYLSVGHDSAIENIGAPEHHRACTIFVLWPQGSSGSCRRSYEKKSLWGLPVAQYVGLQKDNLSFYYKYILWAITHKLNASGHMLIRIFLYYGLWNLYAKFAYTFQWHPVYCVTIIYDSCNVE